jgi:hypothetical protein
MGDKTVCKSSRSDDFFLTILSDDYLLDLSFLDSLTSCPLLYLDYLAKPPSFDVPFSDDLLILLPLNS